jgi:RNA polymerase sigma factor for flagellar operon FliA
MTAAAILPLTPLRPTRRPSLQLRSGPIADAQLLSYHRSRDPALLEAILLRQRPLLLSVAQSIQARSPRHILLDDLVAAGYDGLADAVRRFDPARPVRFKTYATWRIRGAIYDWLREIDPMPRSLRHFERQTARLSETHLARHGREPPDRVIARRASMSVARFRDWSRRLRAFDVRPLALGQARTARGQPIPEPAVLIFDRRAPDPTFSTRLDLLVRRLSRPLSITRQNILRLIAVDGLSIAQIAGRLGLKLGTVETELSRLRRDLRTAFPPEAIRELL